MNQSRSKRKLCMACFGSFVAGASVAAVAIGSSVLNRGLVEQDTSINVSDLQQPDSVQRFAGRWVIDRGDAEGPAQSVATFTPEGNYHENWFDGQHSLWFYNDGMLYLTSRESNNKGRAFVHPFIPVFAEDGNSLTLSSPHAGHVLKLTRQTNKSDQKG